MGSRTLAIQNKKYLELIQIHKSMRLSRDLRPATGILVRYFFAATTFKLIKDLRLQYIIHQNSLNLSNIHEVLQFVECNNKTLYLFSEKQYFQLDLRSQQSLMQIVHLARLHHPLNIVGYARHDSRRWRNSMALTEDALYRCFCVYKFNEKL